MPTAIAGPAGPSRCTALTGSSLLDGPIRIEDHGLLIDDARVSVGARVGIDYAAEDAARPYRFRLQAKNFD
jgi:3-methyladenine DNA glycosylase Mpg